MLLILGITTTIAGTTGGFLDGASTVAQFDGPYAVAFDCVGNLYIGENTNCAIRKITTAGPQSAFVSFAPFI